jgi:hypothetical protein
MNDVKEITVTLPIETINAALGALAKTPYEFAQPHIDLIRDRAGKALAALAAQPAKD